MMPINDFMSVVLPMPLRPMIATISLGATEKLRPCSTSLWPYETLMSVTRSMTAVLSMTEIDFDDLGVGLDPAHRAFGDHLALMQHGDPVGDVLDELHVVLDHDHGAVLDDAVEQFGGLGSLGHAHAGNGLVEHQQVRILDQQHADLEPLLLAM